MAAYVDWHKYLKDKPAENGNAGLVPPAVNMLGRNEVSKNIWGGSLGTAAGSNAGSAGNTGGAAGSGSKTGSANYAKAAYNAAAATGDTGVDTSYYDSMMSAYAAALDAERRARQEAYDAAVQTQQNLYNRNVGKVNSAADKALQEAYINRMQSQRTQRQAMAAQGLTGGASETSMAGILNNYGNARNNIEGERMSQISELGTTLQNNIAQARNILNNGMAGDYADYLDKTAKLYAANAHALVNAGQMSGARNDAEFYASLMKSLMAGGSTAEQAAQVLQAAGLSGGQLQQLFAGQA